MHEYQRYCVDFIETHEEAAVLLGMGLGKTAIALTAIFDLVYDFFLVRKVLVVAPLRVARDQWIAEVGKWEHLSDLRVSVVVGSEQERKVALMRSADVYVINRENVAWLVEKSGAVLLISSSERPTSDRSIRPSFNFEFIVSMIAFGCSWISFIMKCS